MRRTIALASAEARRPSLPETEMAGRQRCRPAIFGSGSQYLRDLGACLVPQVAYLNSGIAFNSSLVALNTAWSGYHGLGFDTVAVAGAAGVAGAVLVFAAPVVVDVAGRVPAGPGPPAAPE